VKCELAPDVILKNGIDVWSVDLFDENPVEVNVNGQPLFFSRLQNASFLLYRNEEFCYLASIDDGEKCSLGFRQFDHFTGKLAHPEAVPQSFDHLYSIYARLGERGIGDELLFFPPNTEKRSYRIAHNVVASGPYDPKEMVLQGTELILPRAQLNVFRDRTIELVPALVETSKSVNWVFENLEQWKPVVYGRTLANLVAGEACDQILFRVDSIDGLAQFLQAQGIHVDCFRWYLYSTAFGTPALTFALYGRKYTCHQKQIDRDPAMIAEVSVDMMQCSAANAIEATRIALFDLSQGQYRKVQCNFESMLERPDRLRTDLQFEGLTYIKPEVRF
jgi:hypothetical protein